MSTLNHLTSTQPHSSRSPWRPASRSLWPASSPVARGNLRCRCAMAPRLASWAEMPPQSWGWCLCCLAWRHWAVCRARLLSDSSRCFVCSEEAGALTLWEGNKTDQGSKAPKRRFVVEQMRLHDKEKNRFTNIGYEKRFCVQKYEFVCPEMQNWTIWFVSYHHDSLQLSYQDKCYRESMSASVLTRLLTFCRGGGHTMKKVKHEENASFTLFSVCGARRRKVAKDCRIMQFHLCWRS